jgi:hypothetical protein
LGHHKYCKIIESFNQYRLQESNDLSAQKVILDNVILNNIAYSFYKNSMFIFKSLEYSIENLSITYINQDNLVWDKSIHLSS